ncbi:OLC1v1012343C1 [Oldenlandia corymbosa var. corymbosa]|uniref:OLC1v1012343C1 n=1 Tax=Oldenlandia corymbosa var. corymbosa TaxID=529605 RepID=A0AAV1DVU8_OLDCO|nr:OLC1v1012343C1 [Oldenlandia corymbosa var. corymbosa]
MEEHSRIPMGNGENSQNSQKISLHFSAKLSIFRHNCSNPCLTLCSITSVVRICNSIICSASGDSQPAAIALRCCRLSKAVSRTPFAFFNSLFGPLFYTQLCNMILMISANATCFCILFFAFNCADGLGLVNPKTLLIFSATGAVLYSIVLANSLIIFNLSLIVSGMENSSEYIGILKACVVIRGRTAATLSLALPVNLALAALEALFQYRIIRAIHESESPFSSIVFEGIFIAYLYTILLVLDTVIGCIFYRSCKSSTTSSIEFEAEQIYQIEFEGKDCQCHFQMENIGNSSLVSLYTSQMEEQGYFFAANSSNHMN